MRSFGRLFLAAWLMPLAASSLPASEPGAPVPIAPPVVFTVEPGSIMTNPAHLADWAENGPEKCWQFSVGARTWFSWGESTWNFSGPGGVPNVRSELEWRNLYSTVFEANVSAVWKNRFLARVDVGAGEIDNGHMIDADYKTNNRTGLFSLSQSDVSDDNLAYINVDFGYRIVSCGQANCFGAPKLTVDALVGYQYWREKYVASNTLQLFSNDPLVPPAGTFAPGPVIKESWERNSVRVGFQGNYQLGDKAALNSRLMFVPWAHQTMVDDHIQTGLIFKNRADGGFGVMWDATASYHIRKGLSAEVGYQIWYQEGGRGENLIVNGVAGTNRVGDLETFRHGILVGLKWRF